MGPSLLRISLFLALATHSNRHETLDNLDRGTVIAHDDERDTKSMSRMYHTKQRQAVLRVIYAVDASAAAGKIVVCT
jgi:hypothetical protein